MFDVLCHADWSCEPGKRWAATAHRTNKNWSVSAPQRVTSSADIVGLMYETQHRGRSGLFGFDFPIGLPVAFGKQTQFTGFVEAFSQFGFGEWQKFLDVADAPDQISLNRPFYPKSSGVGRKHAHIFGPLNVKSIDDLRRVCERKAPHRPAACSLFWTLGGNQVGKAAIDGWQNVVRPALAFGASLWPFDGPLKHLSSLNGCIICETYPREGYNHLGIAFRPSESKKKQEHRRRAMAHIGSWAEKRAIKLTAQAMAQVIDGFGASKSGEDAFDALAGLLSIIEVVEGRRPEWGFLPPKRHHSMGGVDTRAVVMSKETKPSLRSRESSKRSGQVTSSHLAPSVAFGVLSARPALIFGCRLP